MTILQSRRYLPLRGGTLTGPITVTGITTPGVTFPASQSPSADPNTLDDYEEGTFSPTLSFGTPGSSSFSYATRVGSYTKIGRLVTVQINLSFTPTIGTGSGSLVCSLPFTPASTGGAAIENLNASWTWPAAYNQVGGRISPGGGLNLRALKSATAPFTIGAAHMTTGASHTFDATAVYEV